MTDDETWTRPAPTDIDAEIERLRRDGTVEVTGTGEHRVVTYERHPGRPDGNRVPE